MSTFFSTFFCLDRLVLLLVSFCFLNNYPILFMGLFTWFIILCLNKKTHFYVVISLLTIGFLYYFSCFSFNNLTLDDFFNWFNSLFHFSLRDETAKYIQSIHSQQVANFLLLTLLGVKTTGIYDFYYQLIDLSVVHIIVISGFHLSALWTLINFVFKKTKWFKHVIALIVLTLITYLNGFSIGCLRSLLFFIIGFFAKNQKNKMNISILFLLILFPQEILGFSFQMSYISVFVIFSVAKSKISSKIFKDFCISFFVTLFLIPFVGIMNKQMSIWSILYSWFLTPFFILIYFLSLFFCWFNFSEQFLIFFINLVMGFCNALSSVNVFVPLSFFNNYTFSFLYLSICYFFVYQLFERKKITAKLNVVKI